MTPLCPNSSQYFPNNVPDDPAFDSCMKMSIENSGCSKSTIISMSQQLDWLEATIKHLWYVALQKVFEEKCATCIEFIYILFRQWH